MSTAAKLTSIGHVRDLCRSGEARGIRLASNLSQQELAEAIKVNAASVSRWERGIRTPRGDAALRYARLLQALTQRDVAS